MTATAQTLPWFFYWGLGGLFIYGVVMTTRSGITWYRQKRVVGSFARAKGWTYLPRDQTLQGRWQGPPFRQDVSEQAYTHIIRGTDHGHEFVGFEGAYEDHTVTILVTQLPASAPTVEVRPVGINTAFRAGQSVKLESADFNQRFRVYADIPKTASDVLTPLVMTALLQGPKLSWRTSGWELIAWWSGGMNPAKFLAAQATLRHVVEGLPSFVRNDYHTDPSTGPIPAPAEATHLVQAGQPVPPAPAPQAQQALPPAGWYLDPENPSAARYWNGAAWTTQRGAIRAR